MSKLFYGTAFNGKVRFSVINSIDIVNIAREKHNLSYLPTVVLGRLLTGSALTVPWLSEKETITFVLFGDGPVGAVSAQATYNGHIRGYVTNTKVELPLNELHKFDVAKAVGKGDLTVVRDVGLKTPFVSKVPIISGEIAEDLSYYYAKSEQIPTAIALGVLMDKDGLKSSGGLAIQILDKILEEDKIQQIEQKVSGLSISDFFTKFTELDLINYLFAPDYLYETTDVVFKCACSREKAFESLRVLPREDIDELIAEGKAEVTCKWCSTKYEFGEDELQKLL